jgi:hypothetical protein
MDEKAELLDKVQELEHICQQLSAETETIGNEDCSSLRKSFFPNLSRFARLIFVLFFSGEYISLYQMQRTALKKYYHEREKLITHLSNERAQMQVCIMTNY